MTHADHEQQLLDYFNTYRDQVNLAKFAAAAGVGVTTLKLFLAEQRGLSPAVLAKCRTQLQAQARALQAFL